MAKVSGPLMSMTASGKFASSLVFGSWKGRPTVRQLVQPSNPKTQVQQDARNAMRVLAAGQKFANATTEMVSGATKTDKELLIAAAPGGQAWNGFLVKSGIGVLHVNYDAAEAAWTAIGATPQGLYETAAAALTPAILDVAQVDANGVGGTPMSHGKVFFHYLYALYIAGVRDTAPGATPPVYA